MYGISCIIVGGQFVGKTMGCVKCSGRMKKPKTATNIETRISPLQVQFNGHKLPNILPIFCEVTIFKFHIPTRHAGTYGSRQQMDTHQLAGIMQPPIHLPANDIRQLNLMPR